jgi:hypothetical protein
LIHEEYVGVKCTSKRGWAGLLVPAGADPAAVPVAVRGCGLVYLTADGQAVPFGEAGAAAITGGVLDDRDDRPWCRWYGGVAGPDRCRLAA